MFDNIVTIADGKHIVNTTKLFDAFHCLDPQKTNNSTISDSANASLNCFLKDAKEAFILKQPFIINDQVIYNQFELLNWICDQKDPEFKEDMKKRFDDIFNS